ncbi:hypothetical protein B296_00037441, partial [Ensete ventricosum]
PPYQGAATPAADAVALASGRAGRGRQPLTGALQSAPFAGVPVGGCRPYRLAVIGHARKRRPCGLLPL